MNIYYSIKFEYFVARNQNIQRNLNM